MDQSIAEVLEQCRRRMARGDTIEGCLAAYPSHAEELARLLPIVARVQSLARDPDPSYVETSRQRFVERVVSARTSRPSPSAPGFLPWLQRLTLPVAIVLVLFLSGFGLVQAADNTLPDSPLYSVKQARDTVDRVLARSPEARAGTELRIARQQLNELLLAERLHKNPTLQRRIAVDMVQATNAATTQIGQTSGQKREALLKNARALIVQESRVLERAARGRNVQIARGARALLDQLHADDQALRD